jgi:hypothetical protein
MVTNRTIMAALFTIAIASSFIAVSGLISSAHAIAAKKQTEYGTAPQYLWLKTSLALQNHRKQILMKHKARL